MDVNLSPHVVSMLSSQLTSMEFGKEFEYHWKDWQNATAGNYVHNHPCSTTRKRTYFVLRHSLPEFGIGHYWFFSFSHAHSSSIDQAVYGFYEENAGTCSSFGQTQRKAQRR